MRIIQYFLIGFFLSLCTIPAFSLNCPPPLVEEVLYGAFTSCTLGSGSPSVSVSPGSALADLLVSKTTGSLPLGTQYVNLSMYPDLIEVYFTDSVGNIILGANGLPLGYISAEGLTVLDRDILWDSFLSGAFVSILPGGDSPVALFNIDGIKDNIFATLLVIVGGLLLILVVKYAWSSASEMIEGRERVVRNDVSASRQMSRQKAWEAAGRPDPAMWQYKG